MSFDIPAIGSVWLSELLVMDFMVINITDFVPIAFLDVLDPNIGNVEKVLSLVSTWLLVNVEGASDSGFWPWGNYRWLARDPKIWQLIRSWKKRDALTRLKNFKALLG